MRFRRGRRSFSRGRRGRVARRRGGRRLGRHKGRVRIGYRF